ncbi:ras-related protein RabC-like [Melitaea cinxia]|uniref:ras-related protein RabC-like n=1 Tax=Melitaea cinxia TaxID=113334 RepID=UPI001E2732B2|nr:ras-related protein RabC-like [Melitaea cinxia]
MSDDVFEDDTLRAPAPRGTPSPTGYRDYRPDSPARSAIDDDMPIHKTILLGDSGVGKTSLLVQFETGKFQSGNFSATVGIGFTIHPSALKQINNVERNQHTAYERWNILQSTVYLTDLYSANGFEICNKYDVNKRKIISKE